MLGSTVAHYKVTAKLIAGGFGEAYRASDSKAEREVTTKKSALSCDEDND